MTNALHLSKLSRGYVALSKDGSHLEVFADRSEHPLASRSGEDAIPHMPKTFSTKRGPLVLFADTTLRKASRLRHQRDRRSDHDSESPSLISPPPLKFGELKRSILAYGSSPENLNADGIIDEDGTFVYMKVPSKKRLNASKYAGISPSVVLKRRFMLGSGEDRRKDLDLTLDPENPALKGRSQSLMKTHVLSDEISLIPPIYRNPDITSHTPSIGSDSYRFFRIDNNLFVPDSDRSEPMSTDFPETLKIVNGQGSVLAYDKLNQEEKEKVLADLLIQSALQNIADQPRVEVFEDALNRVRDNEWNTTDYSIDAPPGIEEPAKHIQLPEPNFEENQSQKTHEEQNEAHPPQYMFGKMQGSKWSRHRPLLSNSVPTVAKQSTTDQEVPNPERSSREDQNHMSNEFVHSKLFRVSRLLAPISTSSYQESLVARTQQFHFNPKVSSKMKKPHEIELQSQHRANLKLRPAAGHVQLNSSPVEFHNELGKAQISPKDKEKSSIDFNRQRSSKSIKKHTSRQGTGKTFATDRCVTSPLSVRETTARLRTIETPREESPEELFDPPSSEITMMEEAERRMIHNTPHSRESRSEHDQNDASLQAQVIPPSNTSDVFEPTTTMNRSAYTHRSIGTVKSKQEHKIPPGALLIAPDGEILTVGGPGGHPDALLADQIGTLDSFGYQQFSASMLMDDNESSMIPTAPCVPIVGGMKRGRLPDETVVRRTVDLTAADVDHQMDLHTWSYELPVERRRHIPDLYQPIPAAPPIGLSGFPGRRYHMPKRNFIEAVHRHPPRSMLSMTTDAFPPSQTVSHNYQKSRTGQRSESPLLSFTGWTYQKPPTPPAVKKPYLYRPDYRAPGVHGQKHPLGESETLIRRTIDVHAGDIDASLSFTIWVYDMWINDLIKSGADPSYIKEVKSLFELFKQRRLTKVDLQDKDFLTALANHAQALAKVVLRRSDSGHHLTDDVQLAIIENLRRLKYLLDQRLTTVSDDLYLDILRDTLQHVLTKGNLQNLQVSDDVLISLMDYPLDAFEICVDPESGEEIIRIKSGYRTKKNKVKGKTTKRKTKTIIISEEISADDFYRTVDPQTNQSVYRFIPEIAEQKGFNDLLEANFSIVVDKITREQFVKLLSLPPDSNFQVEIYQDPDSRKQILVLRKEVPKTPPMIQSDINVDDFELVFDEITGEQVLRLRPDVAMRKGLTSLLNTNFEVVIDPVSGEQIIRIKLDPTQVAEKGRVEIITDPLTGKQTIRMVVDDDSNGEGSSAPIVTITENQIDASDFETYIDPTTGREVLRMKADVLKAKGLEELANVNFQVVVDESTGETRIVMTTPTSDISAGTNANFEIIIDRITGKQKIIKRTVTGNEESSMDVTESQLNVNDFERVIDSTTGEEVLRLKKGAAARKGLNDLLDVEFEMVTGADGKKTIVVKGGASQGNTGNAQFELITDASGRTTIKVKKERIPTPDLEVTEKPIDINDFEETIDQKTGEKVLKLKTDVARRAGMTELLDAQFETYIDEKTGKQTIRVKPNANTDTKFEIVTDESGKQVLRMVQEIPKTIEVTDSDVNRNDFEEVIDKKTGKKVIRMKKEVAKRKGFVDMDNVDFELVIDEKTGQETVQLKSNAGKITKGNVTYELVIDTKTGQQTLRMKQEIETTFETLEDDLAVDDFEEMIDEVTGERILKLTATAAARKGLTELKDVAFEVYTDPHTGKEEIRVKGGHQTGKGASDQKFELFFDAKTGQQKIVLKRPRGRTPPPVEKSIDVNDFEKVVDQKTGKEFYRLTEAAARRKGLTSVQEMEFDIEVDVKTGKTTMKPKATTINGQKVEVIVDEKTGEQVIRVVQEKPPEIAQTATIKTTIDLNKQAFTVRVDPNTGKQVIQLDQDIVKSYGLENVEFEQVIDEKTGEQVIRMKPVVAKDGRVFELITDPTTGRQTLQIKETVTPQQFKNIVKDRESRGLPIPRPTSNQTRGPGAEQEKTTRRPKSNMKKNDRNANVDGTMTHPQIGPGSVTPVLDSQGRPIPAKGQTVQVKSPSGDEYEIDWTSDDENQLDGLNIYEQRKRKQELLAEKRRKVAEMKRQQELALQLRLKKQREGLSDSIDSNNGLLNEEEKERVAEWERDLRKLDAEREGLTDEEYQARRKKLFAERTQVLKGAYDRKMDRIKRRAGLYGSGRLGGIDFSELEHELQAQIKAEEEHLLSMMSPEEREEYIRARNEERARQRLLVERERLKREEELQAALAETKRMAAIRAAEIMAKELQFRSANLLYSEMKELLMEQKISRAFTYSYFSLLQYLSS